MEWFKSSLQAAQKQAQEAAEKARVLAQQASQQARVLAEQATEKAKGLAAAAAEEAQAKLQQLNLEVPNLSLGGGGGSGAPDADPAELARYGVSPGLLETVAGMTYSTFSDYPLDELAASNPMGLAPPLPPPGFRLSGWQERHALLVLARVDALQGLRFALCPKRMSEEMFWIIYFTLVRSLMPPEAFNPAAAPPPPTPPAAATPKLAASASSSAKRLPATAPTSTSAATPALAATAAAASTPSPARTAASTPAGPASAAATTPRGHRGSAAKVLSAGGGHPSPITGDEAELLELGATSSLGDEDGEEQEQDHVGGGAERGGGGARGHGGEGGGHGADSEDEGEEGDDEGLGDLDALEDDPELAAYLQDAIDGDADGEGGLLSGSASDNLDDLDDYIASLDAELAEEGGGEGADAAPGGSAKSTPSKKP